MMAISTLGCIFFSCPEIRPTNSYNESDETNFVEIEGVSPPPPPPVPPRSFGPGYRTQISE